MLRLLVKPMHSFPLFSHIHPDFGSCHGKIVNDDHCRIKEERDAEVRSRSLFSSLLSLKGASTETRRHTQHNEDAKKNRPRVSVSFLARDFAVDTQTEIPF